MHPCSKKIRVFAVTWKPERLRLSLCKELWLARIKILRGPEHSWMKSPEKLLPRSRKSRYCMYVYKMFLRSMLLCDVFEIRCTARLTMIEGRAKGLNGR
jgi:hypothetical protein